MLDIGVMWGLLARFFSQLILIISNALDYLLKISMVTAEASGKVFESVYYLFINIIGFSISVILNDTHMLFVFVDSVKALAD